MKMNLLTYFCAYGNVKLLWLMGTRDDNLDQSHAWSKMAHPENVDVFFFAFLHKELYE